MFNTLEPDCADGKWQGSYPQGLPVTLVAVPGEGFEFVRWDISGAEFSSGDETSTEAVVVPDEKNVTIKAVYTVDDRHLSGDVNGDKIVDSVDASSVLAYYTIKTDEICSFDEEMDFSEILEYFGKDEFKPYSVQCTLVTSDTEGFAEIKELSCIDSSKAE